MYQQAQTDSQAGQADGADAGAGAGSANDDDDVVDADFEEVKKEDK